MKAVSEREEELAACPCKDDCTGASQLFPGLSELLQNGVAGDASGATGK